MRRAGYEVVRLALGLVLLTAAALKGHQLATEPVVATGLLDSRWFPIGPRWLLIGIVEFELFFGLWLLSGLFLRRTRQAALLCFGAFACISLYKALSGEATCGCFGRVPVNPWYTFALDLAAVTALLRWQPATNPASSPRPLAGEGPGVRAGPRSRLACVLGISLLAAVPAAWAMASYQAATLDEAGDIFGDSEFVVLKPETWVGKRFALLKYIDIGEQLAEGEWIVVLYHHDCPSCREAIRAYERLARVSMTRRGAPEVALVELPPYGRRAFSFDASCRWGRLSDVKEWFVATPIECALKGGSVAKVRDNVRKSSTREVPRACLSRIKEHCPRQTLVLQQPLPALGQRRAASHRGLLLERPLENSPGTFAL